MKHIVRFCCTAAWLTVATAASLAAQTYTVLYQFKSGPHGVFPAAGVTIDTKRRALYGTTENDGKFASGTVYGLNQHGQTVLHSFTNDHGDGAYPIGNGPLLLDAAGNLFGASVEGGIYNSVCNFNGCGIIFKVDQTGKETILYQFTGGDDGWLPRGPLVKDASGNLYGMASTGGALGRGLVFKLNSSGQLTILHNFDNEFGALDGELPLGGFLHDGAGNLFGVTLGGGFGAGTVFKIDRSGNESVLYAFGTNNGDGYEPYNELAIDANGNLYGMTEGSTLGFGTVFKVTPAGKETILHEFGDLPDAQSPIINGVVLDPSATLYGVTNEGGEFGLGAIFKIDTAGNETVIHSFSGSDGKYPYGGLARDPQGNLYGTTSEGGAFGGGVVFRIKP